MNRSWMLAVLSVLGCDETPAFEIPPAICQAAEPFDPAASPGNDVLVSGTLIAPDGLVLTEPAHVFITLDDVSLQDATAVRLAWQYLRVDTLPVAFELRGSAREVFEPDGNRLYSVWAEVLLRDDRLPAVGDLVTLMPSKPIASDVPTLDVEVTLEPLEDCDDPDAGGFCTTCRPESVGP